MPKPWACALCHLAPPDVARSRKKRDLCDLCEPGLAARGLAWCAMGKHRVAIDDMTARGCICRACDNKQRNAAYHRNPERGRALQRGYYWKDPEMRRARSAEYRAANQDAVNARRRLARAANPEHYRAYSRAYYWKDPQAQRERKRRWQKANPDAQRRWRQEAKLKSFRKLFRAA